MKYFLLTLLCFICVSQTNGQTTINNRYGRVFVEVTKKKRKTPPEVEVKLDCVGADSSWIRSTENMIIRLITEVRQIKKGKYQVVAKFIISRDGSLSDVVCEKDPGFDLCNQVLRVLKKSKKWTPAAPVEIKAHRLTRR